MPFGAARSVALPAKGAGRRAIPAEIWMYTPTKSAITSITSAGEATMDSGHKLGTMAGAGNARLVASSLDGVVGLQSATTTTTYCVPLLQNIGKVLYMRCRIRWNQTGNTTRNFNAFGLIAWTLRSNAAETATHNVILSAKHNVQKRIATTFSNYTTLSDSPGGGVGSDFTYTDVGQNWVDVEWALCLTTNELVVRTSDGVVRGYMSDAAVSGAAGVFSCWEQAYNSAAADDPECIVMYSASYEAMTDANARYCNDLLRAGGATGRLDMPGPPPLISIIGATASRATTQTMPAHATGDLIIAWGHRIGTTALVTSFGTVTPTAWSNFTPPTFPTAGQNNESITLKYKIAASSAETFGTWTGAVNTGVIVLRRLSGTWNIYGGPTSGSTTQPGAYLSVGGTSTQFVTYPGSNSTIPWVLQNNSGTSKLLRIGIHGNAHYVNDVPSGFSQLAVGSGADAQGATVILAATSNNITTAPVQQQQSFNSAGATLAISGSIGMTIEVW